MSWEKGDIAICIKDGAIRNSDSDFFVKNPIAIRPDAEYIIHNVYTCPRCDEVCLDIGLKNNNEKHITCSCGEDVPCKEIRWFAEERFKKKIVKRKSDIPFLENEGMN